jgi:hypothetical protein
MRLRFYLAIFALIVSGNTPAQDNRGLGEIAAPVLEKSVKPDISFKPEITRPAVNAANSSEEDTADSSAPAGPQLSTPGINLSPAARNLELGSRFDNMGQSNRYRSLDIIEPADESSIDIKTDNLHIKANVVPPVRSDLGHVLQITVDGEVLVENQTSYMVDVMPRGKRIIQLRILDENGDVVSQSTVKNIYIR